MPDATQLISFTRICYHSLPRNIGPADSQTWFSLPQYTGQVCCKTMVGLSVTKVDVHFYWIATLTPTSGHDQDGAFIRKEIWGTTMQTTHPKQWQGRLAFGCCFCGSWSGSSQPCSQLRLLLEQAGQLQGHKAGRKGLLHVNGRPGGSDQGFTKASLW